ncbi:thymidine phosphorylase [Candidatus Roizmanbacteria bacterium CG_4_10_14_0_8_um_filter_39_9]|uniref:Thymidine phosphorylase n=1 Tax=Candidatus Roizmanbacteria bacterium CG_4_10_14_0_8_um_filter_39_9 TaxID=1974829 RepID=A0A2M7QCR6_9BACT|nr:MAG: thymidine phosphorylase [Candidatus Roizmanbacteria bacterium CG_4_10_14_0_8_um_filter_39_9]
MNNSELNLEVKKTIQKKLLGKKLSYREIFDLMDEIAHNRLGDVLTTYFVAASFKEGFAPDELYHFTKAMVETGERLHFKGIVADKHSIGGLAGTRATMIIVPIVTSAGFTMPKISSRAITSPAGTADVMEVLAPVEFKIPELEEIVHHTGGCICWNGHLGIAPADDIIIRVEEPLSFEAFDKVIVSILAKHVAAGSTHLILDLPIGHTMKIRHEKDAMGVLHKFQRLGKQFGINIIGNIEHTLEPSGNGVGPVLEAIDVLKVLEQQPDRPCNLEKRALHLTGELLNLCYKDSREKKDGHAVAKQILTSGTALQKFKDIILAQGGNPKITSSGLKIHAKSKTILAPYKGIVRSINNYNLNSVAKLLGAPADKNAGLYLHKKIGTTFEKLEPLVTLYSKSDYHLREAQDTLKTFPLLHVEAL